MDASAVLLRQRSHGPGRFRLGITTTAVVLAATRLGGGIGLVATVAPNPTAAADPATAVANMKDIRETLDQAANLLAEGKASKAADRVAQAAAEIGQVSNQERLPSGLRALWDRCRSLRDDIALEGIDVERIRLEPLRASAAKMTGGDRGRTAAASTPAGKPAAAARSAAGFSNAVAPILARHCGGCHIAGRKGGFQMTSYAGLMKTGMVQPGAGEASRLVEVILSGDMPRGGGKVSPDEVGVLMRWIDAGAPFDGTDPTLPIDAIARQSAASTTVGAAAMASPPPTAAVKLKAGEVSFASEVAPVLLEHCAGCHDANNPESNLSMATFERLLRGGRGGAPLVAGKSADSLLVRKIKGAGIEGQRMPLGKDPLPESVIATIQSWVDQGIKLDMLTPKDDLAVVAAAGRASTLSHSDLRPVRFEAGRKLWTRAIPDERPVVEEHGDVLVVGNLSGGRMEDLAAEVEKAEQRLRQDLTGGDVVIKGGLVVYAFAKPYDFSSFWQAVLSDERPKAVTASAGVAGDVVYAALVPLADDSAASGEMAAVVTEQMAAAALLGRGVPAWFARGAGRAVAIKAAPKSAAVGAWRRQLPEAMKRMGSAADVMAGHGDPESLASVSAGFVTTVVPGNRLAAVVEQMDRGAAFSQAFQTVFRSSPQAAFEAWCGQQSRGSKR